MTEAWRPFSARVEGKPWDDALYEGVPQHLEVPLREWLKNFVPNNEIAARIMAQLRIPRSANVKAYADLVSESPDVLLDIVDCALRLVKKQKGTAYTNAKVKELNELFLDSGSAYRVTGSGDALERRVGPTVTKGFEESVKTASDNANSGSAADYLRQAWGEAYGLHPNPAQAYSYAIKAVESSAQSIVQPNHAKATLGTMIPEMRQAAHKFSCVIAAAGGASRSGAEPYAALMEQLWNGQTSRHGSQVTARTETQEEAEAAVHVAILLVFMFSSDAIVRLP
jgi:hypothetical protein